MHLKLDELEGHLHENGGGIHLGEFDPVKVFERADHDKSLDLTKREYLLVMFEHEIDGFLVAEKMAVKVD